MLEFFAEHYPVEYMDSVEALVHRGNAGFDVREVPAGMSERTGGAPSTRGWRLAYYYVRLLVVLLTSYTRPRDGAGARATHEHAATGGRSRPTLRASPEPRVLDSAKDAADEPARAHPRHRRHRRDAVLHPAPGAASPVAGEVLGAVGVAGCGLAVLATAPALLEWFSDLVGIRTPALGFLLMAITFLLVLSLHFSWELSRLEDRTRRLAEECALLSERQATDARALRRSRSRERARDHDQAVGGERDGRDAPAASSSHRNPAPPAREHPRPP